jgi:ABC-type branched-subunit amino acid transport system substrate-binding protein
MGGGNSNRAQVYRRKMDVLSSVNKLGETNMSIWRAAEGWDAAHPVSAKIRQSNNEGKDLMTSKLQRTQEFLEPTKGNSRCEMMGREILPLTELHLRYTKLTYFSPLTLWYS